MSLSVYIAFSLSIFIAGIIAVVRFKQMDESYYPFLFCLWIGCINEVLSLVLVYQKHHTWFNNNIYVLLESLLLLWFFKSVGLFQRKQNLVLTIGAAFVLFWIIETSVRSIFVNSNYFRIFYSLVIVFLSVHCMNKLVFSKKNISKNALFILCLCFIIYFTYKTFLQTFALYGATTKSNFLLNIYLILIYVNLGVNLLYALAVLWIPKKVNYSLQL